MRAASTKMVAVVAVLAGVMLLVVEVIRAARGLDYQLVVWGIVGLAAIAFGLYELFAAGKDEPPPPE